jgi:hypothetical protein
MKPARVGNAMAYATGSKGYERATVVLGVPDAAKAVAVLGE